MRYTIRTNSQTEELIAELLQKYGASKSESINLLAEKYLELKQNYEAAQKQLEEERKLRKSLLRNLENKMNVIYEIENTRLHYEGLPKLKPSDQEPNSILNAAEKYIEFKRAKKIFHHFEKRMADKRKK